MPPKKVLIIGSGPAGLSAAIYLKRGGADALIVEKEAAGGQVADCPKVDNYPAFPGVSGTDLADKMLSQAMDLGAEFEIDEVKELRKEGNVFIARGLYGEYRGDAVIIANGVEHRRLGIAGEEEYAGKGISYCAVCDGAFFKDEEVVLIGDANSAMQYALLLSSLCSKVTIATLFDRFFGEESLVKAVQKLKNVEIIHNMKAVRFNGNGSLESIDFEKTDTEGRVNIAAKGCFVAIGQVPDNAIYKDLVKLEGGYIVTDESMATKTPGIFAAGDTRKKRIRQIVTAENDGAIAALSALDYLRAQS